ncbi:hypothetical protein BAE44_0006196 [Dichanthelium oligosanthes]|uniref:Secreted protein n=1 Tax=Dichanthelium oligosanthes TaxID=888268 RepID=A0A1E5W669_9POAL|nr:hypothetical protein BAE44_0006196 [Dichanthelium oligosanthes]
MVLGVVFIIFKSHQAWGEQDCHADKATIKLVCINTIKVKGDYIPPSYLCRHLVGTSDMARICRMLEPSDEVTLARLNLFSLHMIVARRCPSKANVEVNS